MKIPQYLTIGKIGYVSEHIKFKFLKVIKIGSVFTAAFGEIKGKKASIINMEQVYRNGNHIMKSDLLEFNGIKSTVPLDGDRLTYSINDILIYENNNTSISKLFGVDIYGNATLNHKYLSKSSPEMIEERKVQNQNGVLTEMGKLELKEGIEHVKKVYKYNTVKRYLEDQDLARKYRLQLEDIDNVYKGPGSNYKFKDLVKEFG